MQKFRLLAITLGAFVGMSTTTVVQEVPRERAPLDVARALAARYPAQPIMSYIPGLAWSGSLRLARWRFGREGRAIHPSAGAW